uniref:Cell growth regulator with RING finger domain protein 1 n=1 Tax=Aceria tosichella TaxID=561515 RepID=A0A6G1S9Y7_9ACAR
MMDENQFVSCVPTAIRVEQMKMIRNLIEVKIPEDELNRANFKDGLSIEVKSEKAFIVNAYWIVKIIDIHAEIEKNWHTLHQALTSGKFLSDQNRSLYQNERKVYHETHQQVKCEIRPPTEIDTSSMTQTPRDFYPLVIIVTCLEDDPTPLASDAAANIHIVHIQDSVVPVRSHVIKQYIKQIDGRILDISQLYQEDTAACFICFEEADPDEKLKLFCLLPCRHSPICSNCILRIRECPKCRCPIASVFDINAPASNSTQPAGGSSIDPKLKHLYDGETEETDSGSRPSKGGFFGSLMKSIFGK